ncbi:MAG: hypothetical protein M0R73_03765 [Dehalococcoidia bacterium]|nr:hypothetical protein [Dehalococcoidia bacterium]
MVVATLLTFIVSMGVANAQTVGEVHEFAVHVSFDPGHGDIVDATTSLAYDVSVTRDGVDVDTNDETLVYTGPGDIAGFTADQFQTAFGIPTDAAGDELLATEGVDLEFTITPTAAGEYVVSLQFMIEGTPEDTSIDHPFTVTDAPAPPPPPVFIPEPLPIVTVGDLQVTVANEVEKTVVEGEQTEVTTTTNGVEGTAIAPAGVLPVGARLSVAGVPSVANLEADAPGPEGSTLRLGFVFQATGADGVLLDGPFDGQVILQFTLPAGSIEEGTVASDLVLVYWDGAAWVEVNSAATINEDGSATIVAAVDHFTVFAVLERPGYQVFAPAPAASGISLAAWGGGSFEALMNAVGLGGSVWIFSGGEAIGYRVGAPAFANEPFVTMFPDGLPTGTRAVVVR